MAIWHLGKGRHKKLRAVALPKKGTGFWTHPFPYSSSPLTKDTGNQCRTRPSLWLKGGLYPSWDGEQGWEMLRQPLQAGGQNATDSTMIGKRKGPRKSNLKSRGPGATRTLWAGSSLQVVRCWESPSSTPVQRHRLEVVKSGSLVCRSLCPSTTQVSSQLLSASVPQPHRTRRPLFQPPLSARATLKGPVIWALWSLKLGRWGGGVGEVGAPVPRLVGAGWGLRTGGVDNGSGLLLSSQGVIPVK